MIAITRNRLKQPLSGKFKNQIETNENKNARRPKEAHIARNLKEIMILDGAGEDLKELEQD